MNILDFKKFKESNKKITMVTCYDYWSAKIINDTDVDCILVGDSLAMVMHGNDSTVAATTEIMALHTKSVAKGAPEKFIVGDMPFLSFRKGISIAMDTVESLIKAGANAVKLEGINGHESIVTHICDSGVPVMGHLGLTPQSVHKFGGMKVQGKEIDAANDLVVQAKKLEECGCFSIVLECVPSPLAQRITQAISIPTIGIGAGIDVDGQVLVLQDLLGMDSSFNPKFLKKYLNGEKIIKDALNHYHSDVRNSMFPSNKESYE